MSLGIETRKTFINIKDGKVVKKDKDKELTFDYVEGLLKGVTTITREINKEKLKFWNFEIEDTTGEAYILSLNYNSGVVKSILNSLASVEGEIELIKIKPYLKDEFSKVVVYNNGIKLNWKYTELPPIEIIKAGGKEIKDDSKRMLFFEDVAKELRAKLTPF